MLAFSLASISQDTNGAVLKKSTSLLDSQTEALIDQLPRVSQIGYGYSAMFSGSQFLPDPDSSEVHTLVLGSQAPTNSATIEKIVRRGIHAVPSLLNHLDDARETMIPSISGMMWISFADEYDYNQRLRKTPPAGVNKKDTFGDNLSNSHKITVGDLCFVALGQIVNRSFNATRYQPTGGLVVNSPTCSKRLCAVVREDFQGLTEKKHRASLVQDLLLPDSEDRRDGACRRIAFYYPEDLEPLALKELAVPTYDIFKINDFVRNELYPNKLPMKRRELFNQFIRSNGQAFSDGVLLQLFNDLDLQEADENHNLSPPLKEKYEARSVLVQLYGYTEAVSSTNRPPVTHWANSDLASFIIALRHYKSRKVDMAIHGIFKKITDDDYLATACINRLIGKGYDGEILRFCQRRIPKSEYYTNELREIIDKLDANKSTNTQPNRPHSTP